MALAQFEFIERRQTVHFPGPPGTAFDELSHDKANPISYSAISTEMPHVSYPRKPMFTRVSGEFLA